MIVCLCSFGIENDGTGSDDSRDIVVSSKFYVYKALQFEYSKFKTMRT